MPIMFPGRGIPTMRWRNSPARDKANMTVSCNGILMAGLNVENEEISVKICAKGLFWRDSLLPKDKNFSLFGIVLTFVDPI